MYVVLLTDAQKYKMLFSYPLFSNKGNNKKWKWEKRDAPFFFVSLANISSYGLLVFHCTMYYR